MTHTIEDVMDFVTSDEFAQEHTDYFYQRHAEIVTQHFAGDWDWDLAVQYWSASDIARARKLYEQEAV